MWVIAPSGYVPLSEDFQYKAVDAGGASFEGFNGSDNNYIARFYNAGRTVTAGGFENNGDVFLSPEAGITTRSRTMIGTSTPISNSRLTVRGGDTSTGVPTAVFVDSASQMSLQVQNDRRVGIRAMGNTSTVFNVRGIGSTSASVGFQVQKLSGVRNFAIQDDGLAFFQTTTTNLNSGVVSKGIAGQTTVATQDSHAGVNWQHVHNPTVNGNGRPIGAYFRSLKQGDFTSMQISGYNR